MNHYKSFSKYLQVDFKSRHGLKEKFLLFLVYLQQERNLAFNTIRVYSAALRTWFTQKGWPDPVERNGIKDPSFRLLLMGIRRASVKQLRPQRTPITMPRLIRFVDAIATLRISKLERVRLRAIFLLAFWGLFRASELCKDPKNSMFLRRRDVAIYNTNEGHKYIKLKLRKTKTTQYKPTSVYIYANNTKYCAVAAVAKFIKLTKTQTRSSHFFSLGTLVMSSKYFNLLIKSLASRLQLNPKFYSSHCLRAGGATAATNSGVPPHVIKQMGRWSSNCFELYIRKPKEALLKAQQSILK